MVHSMLYVVTLAVMLGGAAADVMCIMKELMQVTPDYFITNPARACRGVESKFNRLRSELGKCLSFQIDSGPLESLHQEFCSESTDFRQKVNRQSNCLSRNMANAMNCLSSMTNSPNLSLENIMRKSIDEICRSVSIEVASCLAEKVGGACGSEGFEVYGRITKVSEPFFAGSCFAAASIGLGEKETMDEIQRAEQRVVEASVTESMEMVDIAGAASNSALLWCLLLGLLLTVLWG